MRSRSKCSVTNSGTNRKRERKVLLVPLAGLGLLLLLGWVWSGSSPGLLLLNPQAPPLWSHVTGSERLAASDGGMLQFNKRSLVY